MKYWIVDSQTDNYTEVNTEHAAQKLCDRLNRAQGWERYSVLSYGSPASNPARNPAAYIAPARKDSSERLRKLLHKIDVMRHDVEKCKDATDNGGWLTGTKNESYENDDWREVLRQIKGAESEIESAADKLRTLYSYELKAIK